MTNKRKLAMDNPDAISSGSNGSEISSDPISSESKSINTEQVGCAQKKNSPSLPPSSALPIRGSDTTNEKSLTLFEVSNLPNKPVDIFDSVKGGEAGETGWTDYSTPTEAHKPVLPPLPPDISTEQTLQVTNEEFIRAVFHTLIPNANVTVCTKNGDPTLGSGWYALRADQHVKKLAVSNNNYFNCSSFTLDSEGLLFARKANFAGYHLLMLDDIGSKVPFEKLGNFEPSYILETSPGNHQVGYILTEPICDGIEANLLLEAAIAEGLCDAGSTGAQSRWCRLPIGINGKARHYSSTGKAFECRLVKWSPERRYTLEEIIVGLRLDFQKVNKSKFIAGAAADDDDDEDEVFTPKSFENPVITTLKARGLYKTPLGSGKHDITCPWCYEHTDGLDNGTAYFEPDDTYPIGGFRCQHSHGEEYKTKHFLDFLGIKKGEAKHKPVIRIVNGELHHVVNTAEKILANHGRHYQSGGLIVTISTNPETGDPSIVPVNVPALTKDLSQFVAWEKYSVKAGGYIACDPPSRHINILNDSQTYAHLPPLKGIARQPFFREIDGQLVTEPGYDKLSQKFGVFDPRNFVIAEANHEKALLALETLEGLLTEFSYASPVDRSAALSAIFTAVTRTSYGYAPAFHTKASTIGSGKTYQNELISAFAKPGLTQKVSYPTTSEEATKAILSLLLPSPAVIEFDDMATDWIPHGVINRMLTAESISDRILGVSKIASVSTRTLFLSSGNNVGPIRDLTRRVITIHIDHQCAAPALKTYVGSPVEAVRKDRGKYVAAVLTIILAWKAAGSPRAEVKNIATYGGAWADYCRHPLIWLGLPDPATSLLEQVKHDPDSDALLALFTAWHGRFGSSPTTVRKLISSTADVWDDDYLREAICEFHVMERGSINPSKFGWILKRNVDRVVGEFTLKQASADGRLAWMVVKVSDLNPKTKS